jgi:hypothetical protein
MWHESCGVRNYEAFLIWCLPTEERRVAMNPNHLIAAVAVALVMGCAAQSAQAGDPCYHSGTKYSDGGASCQSGREYRCANGEWLSTTHACEAPGSDLLASRTCDFAGITFSTGSASCQAGTQFRCDAGTWRSLGIPCSVGDSPIRVMPSGDTCMFGDATVASGSTICKSGNTFLCNDGGWVNLGTICR